MIALSREWLSRARLRAEERRFRRRLVSCDRCGVLVRFAGLLPSGAALLLDLTDRELPWVKRWLGLARLRSQGIGICAGHGHRCLWVRGRRGGRWGRG